MAEKMIARPVRMVPPLHFPEASGLQLRPASLSFAIMRTGIKH